MLLRRLIDYGLRDYGVAGQIGLEPTPEAYVAKLVDVFRGVRRVLRDDGVLWLNLGDSYWGGKGQSAQAWSSSHQDRDTLQRGCHQIAGMGETRPTDGRHDTLKPKDLIGIPWRVAFALQADGWWLRSDCIWHKPNPMPESVTDRPTKAHEYVFLLTKSARYYYDAEAIRQPLAEASIPRAMRGVGADNKWTDGAPGSTAHTISRPRRNVKEWAGYEDGNGSALQGHSGVYAEDGRLLVNLAGANCKTVWTSATSPYKGAHFATFPEKLALRCILAGSKEGDTVLDPFGGSGTVGKVALEHGRNAVLIDLNPEYIEMAKERIAQATPRLPL